MPFCLASSLNPLFMTRSNSLSFCLNSNHKDDVSSDESVSIVTRCSMYGYCTYFSERRIHIPYPYSLPVMYAATGWPPPRASSRFPSKTQDSSNALRAGSSRLFLIHDTVNYHQSSPVTQYEWYSVLKRPVYHSDGDIIRHGTEY